MHAVMLAAGVGARLGEGDDAPPKALLRFGGRSLLARHIALLRHAGIEGLTLCVGYRAEVIAAEIAACGADDFVHTVTNPDFREGSLVSLWAVREALQRGGDVLLMDADVLYDQRLLARLIGGAHANAFLMDRDIEPGEEPVKLCVRAGRIVDFEKRVEHAHDYHGESVGFFRFDAAMAAKLAARADALVSAGLRDVWYERAIRDLVLAEPDAFGWEEVTGLPWLEIDFPADIARVTADILPRLEPLP
ncbi:MAG TPA: phosphocholine cytidylyltransferase family protein [Alphaproteobacteria bacterium]|nr:phosphocholine cytidylyltransferase family protein [Alphaproteobacteria bacterium]